MDGSSLAPTARSWLFSDNMLSIRAFPSGLQMKRLATRGRGQNHLPRGQGELAGRVRHRRGEFPVLPEGCEGREQVCDLSAKVPRVSGSAVSAHRGKTLSLPCGQQGPTLTVSPNVRFRPTSADYSSVRLTAVSQAMRRTSSSISQWWRATS